MVYLIEDVENKAYKIGYSANPHLRLSSLRGGTINTLLLINVIDGSTLSEKKIHTKFNKFKIKGEWFQKNEEIKIYFDNQIKSIFSKDCIEHSQRKKGQKTIRRKVPTLKKVKGRYTLIH